MEFTNDPDKDLRYVILRKYINADPPATFILNFYVTKTLYIKGNPILFLLCCLFCML